MRNDADAEQVQIPLKVQRLEPPHPRVTCPHCGNPSPADQPICMWCHKPIVQPVSPVRAQSMVKRIERPVQFVMCPKCGGTDPPEAIRCMWCGNPLPNAASNTAHRRASGPSTLKILAISLGAFVALVIVLGTLLKPATLSGNSLLGGSGLNSNPPSYIKQVTAIKEGNRAFQIHFILADDSGQMTTADGTAFVSIVDDAYKTFFDNSYTVKKSDFQKATVGQGSFAHDVVLLNIGRISYANAVLNPGISTGKVNIRFVPTGGSGMIGDDAVIFDR